MVKHKKDKVRKETLDRLHNLDKGIKDKKTKAIMKKLFSMKAFKQAQCVMFYVSKQYEVDTHEMIDEALRLGKRVAIPVTVKEEKRLIISELKCRKGDLVKGHYDIHQPAEGKLRPLSIDDLDMIIVPGIAFDSKNHRLGHGHGYYDKFLMNVPESILTIGLAYDFQVVPELPRHSFDIPVKKLISA